MAKDLAHHLAQECPRRKQQCHICSQAVEFEKMNGHQNKCPRVRISCPNEQCSDKFLRSDLESHLSLCEFESISCKYAKVGCVERSLRKNIKKHEEGDQLHLRVTTEKVLDLTAKMTELVDKETKTSIFKLSGFQKLKRENRDFYTPSFYTSPTGYNMDVGVAANGWGDCECTHISVFFHLRPGDNDDSLTWPFNGAVTIELLNQLEDKNHFCDQINTADNGAVLIEAMSVARGSMGKSKFISHTDLEYQPDKNCQYLKDDTLFFRVSVQVPDNKPWLECTI